MSHYHQLVEDSKYKNWWSTKLLQIIESSIHLIIVPFLGFFRRSGLVWRCSYICKIFNEESQEKLEMVSDIYSVENVITYSVSIKCKTDEIFYS